MLSLWYYIMENKPTNPPNFLNYKPSVKLITDCISRTIREQFNLFVFPLRVTIL